MHKLGDEEKTLISIKPFVLPVVIYSKAARFRSSEGFEKTETQNSADFRALNSALFFAPPRFHIRIREGKTFF
jgi:hypothetical protein